MLRTYVADLHVHTYLSPCAARDASPEAILARCVSLGIDVIAVTDHNSCGNAPRTVRLACGSSVSVIPGMEVTTCEEVHVIVLLPTLDVAAIWDSLVRSALPSGMSNDPSVFGPQWRSHPDTGAIEEETTLLSAATSLSLDDVCRSSASLGGICIPAHVERRSFGILSQLGMVPSWLDLPAIEVGSGVVRDEAEARAAQASWPGASGKTLVSSSDAHSPLEVGRGCSLLTACDCSLGEIVAAMRGIDGRRIEIA